MDYDEIRRVHRLEKNSSQLVQLEEGFMDELNSFLSAEREKYLSSLRNGSLQRARDYNNLKEMIKEILAIRERKVLSKALVASRTNEYALSGMTLQEKELFKKVFSLLKEFKDKSAALFGEEKKKSASKEKGLKKLSLKILSDIPSFIGADLKEYGPFSGGQSIELPWKTAELLIQKKLAIKN